MNPTRGALLKPSERSGAKPTASFSRQRKVSRYEVLKDKIKTWWEDRFRVGEYLKEIRDGKLYRPEHKTFEEFSEVEFGIKQAYAYRLIEASDIRGSLKNSTIVEKLVRPSQATALAAVPEESRVEVLETAAAGNDKVTAKAIATAAAAIVKPKKSTKPLHLDKIGCPIPDDVYPDWQASEAREDILRQAHRLKLTVEKALEDKDLSFREITNSTVADLHNAWSALQGLIPFAVCPTCEGHNRKSCTLCKQRGFLSKFGYEHWVSKKARELREKIYA